MTNILSFPCPQQLELWGDLPIPKQASIFDHLDIDDPVLIGDWDFWDDCMSWKIAVVSSISDITIAVESPTEGELRFSKQSGECLGIEPISKYIDLPRTQLYLISHVEGVQTEGRLKVAT